MDKWWSVSWKRLGKALLIILLTPLILAGVGLLVQYQLAPWRIARILATSFPDLDPVPITPPDKSVATLDGERIERFGFSIQLPWKDVYLDRTWKDFSLISSHDGRAMTMYDPSARLDRSSAMRFLANQVPALRYDTNYALWAAAMDAKSVQVKWWKTSKQNAKDLRLLLIKSEIEVDCKGHSILFSLGKYAGSNMATHRRLLTARSSTSSMEPTVAMNFGSLDVPSPPHP